MPPRVSKADTAAAKLAANKATAAAQPEEEAIVPKPKAPRKSGASAESSKAKTAQPAASEPAAAAENDDDAEPLDPTSPAGGDDEVVPAKKGRGAPRARTSALQPTSPVGGDDEVVPAKKGRGAPRARASALQPTSPVGGDDAGVSTKKGRGARTSTKRTERDDDDDDDDDVPKKRGPAAKKSKGPALLMATDSGVDMIGKFVDGQGVIDGIPPAQLAAAVGAWQVGQASKRLTLDKFTLAWNIKQSCLKVEFSGLFIEAVAGDNEDIMDRLRDLRSRAGEYRREADRMQAAVHGEMSGNGADDDEDEFGDDEVPDEDVLNQPAPSQFE